MQSVTVIGLGGMGSALASALLDAGYPVTVWNRTAAKAAPLVEAGASQADSVSAAIAASPTIITCINSHSDTHTMLAERSDEIAGKQFIELTTGNAEEATTLQELARDHNAECIVGAICSYPSGIGKEGTCILVAGAEEVWRQNEAIIRAMGPASDFIGENVASLAALFAALFLPRQGFMFGMIYGALIAERAGISAEAYFKQVPTSQKVVGDYVKVAAETISSGDFSNRGASLNVYEAAIKDMMDTFEQLKVPADLPKLMHKLVEQGIAAGQGDEELPSLIKIFREDDALG
jgi:3-hydroxyisobutyrate dehydrogenase-like beta-hydroxyacid dehydrogenase